MAERQLRDIITRCGKDASLETDARMEGRTMTIVLAPPRQGGGGGPAKPRPVVQHVGGDPAQSPAAQGPSPERR
jgi:hypothetical protein